MGWINPNRITRVTLFTVALNAVTAPMFIVAFGGIGIIYSTLLSEVVRIAYFARTTTLDGGD